MNPTIKEEYEIWKQEYLSRSDRFEPEICSGIKLHMFPCLGCKKETKKVEGTCVDRYYCARRNWWADNYHRIEEESKEATN